MDATSKELGQYFTPEIIADFMLDLLDPLDQSMSFLEPSCGEGVFIKQLLDRGINDVIGYEVDDRIKSLCRYKIEFQSFVTAIIDKQFDVVIGNPPYVRWRNLTEAARQELQDSKLWNQYFNSLCDFLYFFILRSVELLKDGGQLVFITPGYWLSTTNADKLRNYLVKNGSFERICCFNESPIFKNVASSIIVFKYVKGKYLPSVDVTTCDSKDVDLELLDHIKNKTDSPGLDHFTTKPFETNGRWVLARASTQDILDNIENKSTHTLGEISRIGNGMVTGLDKAFQIPNAPAPNLNQFEWVSTRAILKGKDTNQFNHGETTRYIFGIDIDDEDEFKERCPNYFKMLFPYWDALKARYAYGKDIKPWQWVFLRNFGLFSQGVPRILVPGKERITHKSHFRFCYAKSGVFPTQDVTGIIPDVGFVEGIYYLLAVLNSKEVFQWVKYNGIIKGGVVEFSEKPLSIIPIRRIDWSIPEEVELHKEIVAKTKPLCHGRYSPEQLEELQKLVSQLYQVCK